MFHMCFRRRQQLQWRLNGKKLVLLIFSRKTEVSVVSVLTGSKEVKMKVACFRDTYDYGRLHRADYDVITWWTCKWSVNIFQMAACGPLGKNRLGAFGTPTSHPGRPTLIYKAAELTAKAFARSFTIEKVFPHSEPLPFLTQIWSHMICSSIQSRLKFYNSQKK